MNPVLYALGVSIISFVLGYVKCFYDLKRGRDNLFIKFEKKNKHG